ncbi:TolC family protein [Flagellimonas nanhaiensis]|uniref:TolC family protein n=1 Tax=Flagellimonas nanhaiensis TaxID=2292706 RepID=A0A371JMN4_9FLAO|nr:TolC family protein [Allomuricauda nanhaiensis]RDY58396.1 TolC family protein [Allomuricauda nanhaiensis]
MNKLKIIIGLLLVSAMGNAQGLQSYIAEAQANNPKIQAYELRYTIAREKENEANWLPNTEFGAGYFVSEPETRTGAQVARFSAKQMLPWFGTVATRQKYASAMAETDYVDYVVAKRKLALAVAQSYYELYSLWAKQGVLDTNIELLHTYETLALTSVEVGKASAVDVLRLQIRQNELEQQKQMLREQFKGEQVNFNNLLNRDTDLTVDLTVAMDIPDRDPVTMDSLELNPELLRFDKMYESVTQAELLNQKEGAPMLGFGLDYVSVQERPDMSFSDNGKDIVMPMVSLSIPIFNKRYTSKTKQNELRKEEITFQKQERLNVLESAFAKAIAQRNEARIAYDTQSKNLKQAKDAEQILVKNYETGTIDFNDVLDIQELQLKFQINQIQSVQLYYVQSAIINYLINQ